MYRTPGSFARNCTNFWADLRLRTMAERSLAGIFFTTNPHPVDVRRWGRNSPPTQPGGSTLPRRRLGRRRKDERRLSDHRSGCLEAGQRVALTPRPAHHQNNGARHARRSTARTAGRRARTRTRGASATRRAAGRARGPVTHVRATAAQGRSRWPGLCRNGSRRLSGHHSP
jgi:hypothetical protein